MLVGVSMHLNQKARHLPVAELIETPLRYANGGYNRTGSSDGRCLRLEGTKPEPVLHRLLLQNGMRTRPPALSLRLLKVICIMYQSLG